MFLSKFSKRDIVFMPIAVFCCVWLFSYVKDDLLLDKRYPIDIKDVRIVGPITPGKPFILEVSREKVRDCISDWDLFFVDGEQTQHIVASAKPGSAVGIGNDTIRVPLIAPHSLEHGEYYTFKSIGTYVCGEGKKTQSYTIRQPDILVKVTK